MITRQLGPTRPLQKRTHTSRSLISRSLCLTFLMMLSKPMLPWRRFSRLQGGWRPYEPWALSGRHLTAKVGCTSGAHVFRCGFRQQTVVYTGHGYEYEVQCSLMRCKMWMGERAVSSKRQVCMEKNSSCGRSGTNPFARESPSPAASPAPPPAQAATVSGWRASVDRSLTMSFSAPGRPSARARRCMPSNSRRRSPNQPLMRAAARCGSLSNTPTYSGSSRMYVCM